MAPTERIRQAIKDPAKRAAFDRAMACLADRVEQLANEQGDAQPAIRLRVHRGGVVSLRVERDEEFA